MWGGVKVDVFEVLNDYEDVRVNWNLDSIIDVIEGKNIFEDLGSGEE